MRFALRPRWMLGHVAVVAAVVVMINLGFWQLRRLDERRAQNEQIASAIALPPSSPAEIADSASAGIADAEYRRVRAEGEYDARGEFLARYRSFEGLSGHHVVTPLLLDGGTVVLVNRGWVPAEYAARWPVADAAPPDGRVEVLGYVRSPETRGVDSREIDQIDARAHRFWLQLIAPEEADGIPATVPLPERGDGPHLGYAVQWFVFSMMTAGGWLILLRSSARRARQATAAAP